MRSVRASKAARAAATTAAVLPRGKVPTLTEVVEIDDSRPVGVRPPALELVGTAERIRSDPPTVGTSLSVSAQAELTQRVLRSVQQQVDSVLEARLKDLLVPILAQCAESMMAALRADLASTLHGVVSEAVAGELARQERKV